MCTSAVKMKLIYIFPILSIVLTSCASVGMEEWNVYDKNSTSMGTTLPSNNENGIIAIHLNSSQKYASHFMRRNCESFGGLNEESVTVITGQKTGLGFYYYSYKCKGIQTINQPSMNVNTLQSLDIDSAKKKCSDLGFKTGTEGFGKCVLQLSK